MDVRRAAAEILSRIERERTLARDAWEGERPAAETALVLGTLRRRGTIDAVLAAHSSRKLPLIKPGVRAVLRVALFEILWLDDSPAHAVVHAAVENVKALGRFADLGFVNALLRGIVRGFTVEAGPADERRTLPRGGGRFLVFRKSVFPAGERFLAARGSTAPWIARRRLAELGPERALACLDLQAETPRTCLRIAPGREREVEEALAKAAIPFAPDPRACLLALPPQVRVGPLFELVGEHVVVQDAVASQVAPFLAPAQGARLLDFCAAPGGKATHLAQLVGPRGEVRAWDIDPDRLALVAENARRLGLAHLSCGPAEGEYDGVLVDAPCSNTGVLARRPEARWRVREKHLPGLAERQLRILKDASRHVGPSGTLVYSTCSLESEENLGVVEAFLGRGGFRLEAARTVYPDEAGGDGGFMARLLRL